MEVEEAREALLSPAELAVESSLIPLLEESRFRYQKKGLWFLKNSRRAESKQARILRRCASPPSHCRPSLPHDT